jgi:DNA-binding transcriptional ArsR family regulator
MTKHLNVTQSAVSQHLRILKQVGLVRGERRGSFVHYTLEQEGITKYKALLSEILGEQFIEV